MRIDWPIEPIQTVLGKPIKATHQTCIGACVMRWEHDEDHAGESRELVLDYVELGGAWWHAVDVLLPDVIEMVCRQEQAAHEQRHLEDRAEAHGRARNERHGVTA